MGIMMYNWEPVQASLFLYPPLYAAVLSDLIPLGECEQNTKNFRITGHEICLTLTMHLKDIMVWLRTHFETMENFFSQFLQLSNVQICYIQSKLSLPIKSFALSGMLNKPRNRVLTRININVRSYLWAHVPLRHVTKNYNYKLHCNIKSGSSMRLLGHTLSGK